MSHNGTTDTDRGYKKAMAAVKSMAGSCVDIGYWGPATHPDSSDAMVTIAATHEFGSPRRHIPERSFLRSTVDKNRKRYKARKRALALKVLDGKTTTEAALAALGEQIASDIQATISQGIPPPLSDRTLAERKHGGDTPLIDTGTLRASIQTRIVLRGQVVSDKGGVA